MWRDDAYLLDILLAASEAAKFAEGLTFESFKGSKLHQHAIVRTLEIVGEAARKISQEFKDAHPDIPWHKMIGMRHRLIHDYLHVNLETVWDTIRNDIPGLIEVIGPLVPPENE